MKRSSLIASLHRSRVNPSIGPITPPSWRSPTCHQPVLSTSDYRHQQTTLNNSGGTPARTVKLYVLLGRAGFCFEHRAPSVMQQPLVLGPDNPPTNSCSMARSPTTKPAFPHPNPRTKFCSSRPLASKKHSKTSVFAPKS